MPRGVRIGFPGCRRRQEVQTVKNSDRARGPRGQTGLCFLAGCAYARVHAPAACKSPCRVSVPASRFIVDFRLALRNSLRQRRRSFTALLAIGCGVVAMMLAAGYMEWIFWANREKVAVTQMGHVQISRAGFQQKGRSKPMHFLLPAQDTVLPILAGTPGLRSLAPRLNFRGLASHEGSTLSFVGEGIDPARDPSGRNLEILQGHYLSNADPKGILMGVGLAANLGVKISDTVVLLANTANGSLNAVETHVRGLAATSMKAYDDSMLRVTLDTARTLLRTQGAHLWVLALDDTQMTRAATTYLQAQPDLAAYDIVPWFELADFHNKTVALFSRQMGVVKLIIAAIIVLSISNTMTMSVLERTVEIGTAMALGIRRRRILGLFLLEGGLLGLMGGLGGIVLGYLAAQAITSIGIPMPPAPGMSRGFVAGIIITPDIALQALILAMSTTLLASLYPAWRASRMVIVDALRHNR